MGLLFRLATTVLTWGLIATVLIDNCVAGAGASGAGRFEVRQLAASDHRYVVYFPPGYTRDRRWPVILFLHGAGERGQHALAPTYAGLGPVLRHSPELYPCIVVFPQCESWDDRIYSSWSPDSEAGQRAMRILEEVEQSEAIDVQHRSLTGWSMGGFGASAWANQSPGKWRAALAVSGGLDGPVSKSLVMSPFWLIHADQDAVVSVERSRELAAAFQNPNAMARYDEITGAGHEVWERVYSEPRVARWLIEGGEHPAVDWSVVPNPQSLPTGVDGAPFIPAATVSHALAMRIGNDALRMVSAGIPESVKPERLQGTLPDIRESMTVDGETYELALTGLTYAARLESSELSCQSTGEILADLGVGLELRIRQASLATKGFSAQTGAFRIVIGHRRPVSLQVRIAPRVDRDMLRLTHRDTTFPIPDDDWYVEIPREIEIHGNKFSRHEIETGIVGGLYTRKAEVEEQVRSVIPPLLEKVEQRLNLDTSGQLTRWLWPFPVYQPRLRWKPESISVDIHGMSVRLGAVIASNTFEADRPVRSRDGAASLTGARIASRDLHLVVDPALVESVSEEFALSGVARINVLDLPEERFQSLADRNWLREALPDLPADTEVRSVLAMTGPFRYSGMGSHGRNEFHLLIPQAGLEVFQRQTGQTSWTAAGRFPITVDQAVLIDLTRAPQGPPLIEVRWSRSPVVTLGTAQGATSSGTAKLETELRAAWVSWAQTRDRPAAPTEDFALGHSRLRLREIELEPRSLAVELFPPTAEIRVSGTQPLRYRIRPHGGSWSLPHTLQPGQTETIAVTDIAQWQEIGHWSDLHTVSPGEVIDWNAESGATVLSPATREQPSPPVTAR